jgi:hypothetical protein
MSIKVLLKTIIKFMWYWIDILGGSIISVLFLIVTIYFDIDILWLKYLAAFCIAISLPASIIRIIREKNLVRTDFSITKLELLDNKGNHISPYKLSIGENEFHCRATYADGFINERFPVCWTCFPKGSTTDPFSVFGEQKRASVVVNCNNNHEQYSGLACWLFKPNSKEQIPGNKHSSLSFEYDKSPSIETFCQDCGKKLNILKKECPYCNSKLKHTRLHLKDKMTIREQLRSKNRKKIAGKNKVVFEEIIGDDYHTEEWNFLHRIIDRINDRYYKLVKYGKTDLVIRKTDGKLSEHQGYGSVKWKKK